METSNIINGIFVLLLGLVSWDIKQIRSKTEDFIATQTKKMDNFVKEYTDKCHQVQLGLQDKFANKQDTKDNVNELFHKVDVNEKDISWLKAKQNGIT